MQRQPVGKVRLLMLLALMSTVTNISLVADDDVVTGVPASPIIELELPRPRLSILGSSSQVDESLVLRKQLESRLVQQLKKIDAECSLTIEQQNKLQLAGKGDILRLLAELEMIEQEAYSNWKNPGNALFNLHIEVEKRILIPATSPFSSNSLFGKVLTKHLTAEQRNRFAAFDQQEQVREIRATFNGLYRGGNSLSEEQLSSIARLCRERYPEWRPLHFKSVSFGVAMLIADEMEADFKPLFTDQQWQQMQDYIRTAKSLEPMLRSYEMWPIRTSTIDEQPRL